MKESFGAVHKTKHTIFSGKLGRTGFSKKGTLKASMTYHHANHDEYSIFRLTPTGDGGLNLEWVEQ